MATSMLTKFSFFVSGCDESIPFDKNKSLYRNFIFMCALPFYNNSTETELLIETLKEHNNILKPSTNISNQARSAALDKVMTAIEKWEDARINQLSGSSRGKLIRRFYNALSLEKEMLDNSNSYSVNLPVINSKPIKSLYEYFQATCGIPFYKSDSDATKTLIAALIKHDADLADANDFGHQAFMHKKIESLETIKQKIADWKFSRPDSSRVKQVNDFLKVIKADISQLRATDEFATRVVRRHF